MAGASMHGDYYKLRQLIAGLQKLTQHSFKVECNRLMAESALGFVQRSFASSADPYGRPWKPLKYRKGQILQDKGNLYASIRPRHSSAGFYISTPVVYAATHNYGHGPVPMRKFIPSAKRLPAEWRRSFVSVLREQRKKALGR